MAEEEAGDDCGPGSPPIHQRMRSTSWHDFAMRAKVLLSSRHQFTA